MNTKERIDHWNNIHTTRKLEELSWYQVIPTSSLELIHKLELPKEASIIDIGGGDSYLVDFLLKEDFTNISVLDVSNEALKKVQKRLEEKASEIEWIVADVSEYIPEKQFDLWHDRAAFHFLNDAIEIEHYKNSVVKSIKPGGFLLLGTFSMTGPDKCSGIQITKYSIVDMQDLFADSFELMEGFNIDHNTPRNKVQNFTFCLFRRPYS